MKSKLLRTKLKHPYTSKEGEEELSPDLPIFVITDLAYLTMANYKKIVIESIKTLTVEQEFDLAVKLADELIESIFTTKKMEDKAKEKVLQRIKARQKQVKSRLLYPTDLKLEKDFKEFYKANSPQRM